MERRAVSQPRGSERPGNKRQARERFRNPPAHARFVPMRVAKECRTHVDDALEQLFGWLKAYQETPPPVLTVH